MPKQDELNKLESRPWGGYIILIDNENYKVKKLIINQKKDLAFNITTKEQKHGLL